MRWVASRLITRLTERFDFIAAVELVDEGNVVVGEQVIAADKGLEAGAGFSRDEGRDKGVLSK